MDYYEQLYAHTLDNPDKTGQFFEGYSLPTFTQEEIDNLNGPIFTKESEPMTFQKFPGEFYQIFKEEITPILYNLFQRRETEYFLSYSITLTAKPDKNIIRKL